MLGNKSGVVMELMGALLFGVLDGIGVDFGGKSLGTLVGETLNNNFMLQLGLMARLDSLSKYWDDPALEEAKKDLLSLAIGAGNYQVGATIHEISADFADSSAENVTLADRNFNPESYALSANLQTVYASFSLDFDITGVNGTKFGLDETLSSLLAQLGVNDDGSVNSTIETINGLGLAPVIQLLSTLSNHYTLEFEGNINLTDIIDNGLFYDTNFSIVLRDRNETAVYDGVTKYKEVLSAYYIDRALYLNAECFNIQAVRIDNVYDFIFHDILTIYGVTDSEGNFINGSAGSGTEEGTEEGTGSAPSNAGFAGYESNQGFDPFAILRQLPEGASEIATYINLLVCPEGFMIGIGTAALFGVLTAIGGEAMDYSSYVEPIGEVSIELGLFQPEDFIGLDLVFEGYEYNGDERVNIGTEEDPVYKKSGSIGLGLSFSNDIQIAFTYQWTESIEKDDGTYMDVAVDKTMHAPEHAYLDDGSTQDYVVFDQSNPVVGLSTTLYIDVAAGKVTGDGTVGDLSGEIYTGYELNQEPLTTLLGGLINVSLSLLLEIMEDQEFSVEAELLVNIPLRNWRGIEVQITIRRVDNGHNYTLVQANLHNSTMYIDLTPVNGPKFAVVEVLEALLGEKEYEDNILDGLFGGGSSSGTEGDTETGSEPSNASGPSNATGGNKTPVNIDLGAQMILDGIATHGLTQMILDGISTHGLALYVTETAVNSLLRTFQMNDLRIFSGLLLQVFLAPKLNSFMLRRDEQSARPRTRNRRFRTQLRRVSERRAPVAADRQLSAGAYRQYDNPRRGVRSGTRRRRRRNGTGSFIRSFARSQRRSRAACRARQRLGDAV